MVLPRQGAVDAFAGHVIPKLLDARVSEDPIRVWCAAASTGQEAYSVAMWLSEMAPQLAGRRIDIVATDLSHSALEKASAGVYSQSEVQRGLPARLLVKYFTQEGDAWRISPEIRAMVQFRPFNLLQDFTALGRFDVCSAAMCSAGSTTPRNRMSCSASRG
jgi:chemotaxis protein methyltransferase CheR